jgi:hypothetical protein
MNRKETITLRSSIEDRKKTKGAAKMYKQQWV